MVERLGSEVGESADAWEAGAGHMGHGPSRTNFEFGVGDSIRGQQTHGVCWMRDIQLPGWGRRGGGFLCGCECHTLREPHGRVAT